MQYGKDVPQATIGELKSFVQEHPRGTVLAPYPALGDKIALGAWVDPRSVEAGRGNRLPREVHRAFDETAFDAFFDAYQFQGPERFPPDSLLPGRS